MLLFPHPAPQVKLGKRAAHKRLQSRQQAMDEAAKAFGMGSKAKSIIPGPTKRNTIFLIAFRRKLSAVKSVCSPFIR